MNILVIGSGGREHALIWKLKQSPLLTKLYAAPGSDAIGQLATRVDLADTDVEGLAAWAQKMKIDLTIVGPEAPLVAGIVDVFTAQGLKIVGPTQHAAQIEGSKAFAKALMQKHGIPTARFFVADDVREAQHALAELGLPVAIKADGLAGGKGVMICQTEEEALSAIHDILLEKRFGTAGTSLVIEEFLRGEEASFIALTDGTHVLPLASSQDHKRLYDNDEGPNTGGMGAYSPAPVVTSRLNERVLNEVMIPTVRAMAAEGTPFRGILYAGLMIEGESFKVLEFNARFGDPETQPILSRLKSDLLPLLAATCDGTLDKQHAVWDERPAVCVVMASGGYPLKPLVGYPINGLTAAAALPDVMVFHAGTTQSGGAWMNTGGRVLGVTALGRDIEAAIAKSYEAVALISWQNEQHRTDIAKKAIGRGE